jgi:formylglycine-generating enzyme required for sulfatase activity
VPSLRDWLTRKQKETRRGRAELLLADRAAVWNSRSENQQLPSLLHWLQIRWWTAKRTWTPQQQKMMQKAGKYYAVRGFAVAVVIALVAWGAQESRNTLNAHHLAELLLDANIHDVPSIVRDMAPYRPRLDPLLLAAAAQAEKDHDRRKQLHASLALLPVDASQVDYLEERLLDAQPEELLVLREALAPYREQLLNHLWAVVEAPEKGKESQRLRAGAALAQYDPTSAEWLQVSPLVVHNLVRENDTLLGPWSEAYRPIKNVLFQPLADIFGDHRPERAAQRAFATNLLADYMADNAPVLADLLMDADEKQFPVIYAKHREQGEKGLPVLTGEIGRKLPADLPSSDEKREQLAKRQANAAVALLLMNQTEKVWPHLTHSPDPRARSYLIRRLVPLGADAQTISQRLDDEPDLAVRRALVLILGEFTEKELPADLHKRLLSRLQTRYQNEADPGLHAAMEWLLRQWQQQAWLRQVNDAWAKDKQQRDRRLQGIRQVLTQEKGNSQPQWYVNSQGQTFVVLPDPAEFLMGSPVTEQDREPQEVQHLRRIGRTFALAAAPVTREQYQRFRPDSLRGAVPRYPLSACPIGGMNWYDAAAYCNWLSQREGIAQDQWCYETNSRNLKPNYLHLTGYRLPTEAEIEYACRAGAITSRFYGETAELLGYYGWHYGNSPERSQPVGGKKPNDWGFFDLHGNIRTWCIESARPYPRANPGQVIEDTEELFGNVTTTVRATRGGSFILHAPSIRSANRTSLAPLLLNFFVGIRPARTIVP